MNQPITALCLTLLLGAHSRQDPAPVKTPPRPAKIVYALVCNVHNPYVAKTEHAKALIRKLYLAQLRDWPEAGKARAFGHSHGSHSQRAFESRILGMSPAEMARYWLKIKNLNGTTPPMALSSDRKIAKFVKKYKGAFGWMKASNAKNTGLKILFQF